jgi:iron complex outermembrane receptor protein
MLVLLNVGVGTGQESARLRMEVRSDDGPVRDAEVVINGIIQKTGTDGATVFTLPPGHVEIVVVKSGFAPASASVDVVANQQQTIVVELNRGASVEEHVTVAATRTDRGIEDQPMRVEVVDAEEIDEKSDDDARRRRHAAQRDRWHARPGDVAVARRRQHQDSGMRGRYTRFLSDGLPLFGEQVSLGLMQIPPLDLGRVEVIKGVASSLYGAGAMSGVVNLVSKRPDTNPNGRFCSMHPPARDGRGTLVFPRRCPASGDSRSWAVRTDRHGRT